MRVALNKVTSTFKIILFSTVYLRALIAFGTPSSFSELTLAKNKNDSNNLPL